MVGAATAVLPGSTKDQLQCHPTNRYCHALAGNPLNRHTLSPKVTDQKGIIIRRSGVRIPDSPPNSKSRCSERFSGFFSSGVSRPRGLSTDASRRAASSYGWHGYIYIFQRYPPPSLQVWHDCRIRTGYSSVTAAGRTPSRAILRFSPLPAYQYQSLGVNPGTPSTLKRNR